jgi:NAD(P)-dependent dehydrogenase (short-subunit alcohol dehydrogenase family)
MGRFVVTGAASGMGAATTAALRADGHEVLTVDRHRADVVADLEQADERRHVVDAVTGWAGSSLDGLATFAGVVGLPSRPGRVVASVNYFGTVQLLAALRPLLAAGDGGAALAISSNAATTTPGLSMPVVEACLADDESKARELADEAGSANAYAASKLAVARWVRRHAPTPEWIGAGVTLNAIAPGATETAMLAESRADPDVGPLVDQFPVPAGRTARAEEVAPLATLLLGPQGRFFCGSVLLWDGGTEALFRADDWPGPLSG